MRLLFLFPTLGICFDETPKKDRFDFAFGFKEIDKEEGMHRVIFNVIHQQIKTLSIHLKSIRQFRGKITFEYSVYVCLCMFPVCMCIDVLI